MRIVSILLLFAASVSACHTAASLNDERLPYARVSPGSHLNLNQEITVPGGQVGVYLQNGRVINATELNRYLPFCKFELYDMSHAARVVKPDDILVIHSEQQELGWGFASAAPVVVAANGWNVAGLESGPSLQSYVKRMDLRSDKQPDIFRLSCGMWGYPSDLRHVTIAEMRAALGDVFTLRLR